MLTWLKGYRRELLAGDLGAGVLEAGIDACVSSWQRFAPNTIPAGAKAGGNYLSGQLIAREARRLGFGEGIALASTGLLSEGAGENLFLVFDGALHTTPVSAALLNGITRNTIITLARDAGIPLVLQALFYPSVQLGLKTESLLTYSANTLLSWDLMHWFETNARGGELRQRWHREPLHAPDHRGVAPAWIGLAECDPLTDEGKLYAQKLKDAGVPAELTVWPGVIHDFINLGRFVPEAAQAHQQLAAALKRAYQA